MKNKLLLLIPAAGLVGFSFLNSGESITTYHADGIETVNFSSNPPTAKTGAPGENTCTQCHSGDVMSSEGVVFFTIGGGPDYIPGNTYPVTVSVLSGDNNGFQLTILDTEDNQAGTFTAGAGMTVASGGGREYIHHSTSAGVTSWTFDWTAPADGTTGLRAYYTVNISNNNGSTSGDEIFMGETEIPLAGASLEQDELNEAFNIYFNNVSNELNLNYTLFEESKVVLNVQDLSGKLITHYDLGMQNSGEYQEILPVTEVTTPGVYVLSLFINNRVFNRKIAL